jgi:hypothetical protein
MNWTSITLDDLKATGLAWVVEKAQDVSTGTVDPGEEAIAMAVARVRRSVAGGNPLDADTTKVPGSLKSLTVRMALFALMERLNLPLSEDQRDTRKNDNSDLLRIADRKVLVEALERDRELLWAEAMHLYRLGEQWWLTDEEHAQQRTANAQLEDESWREDEIGALLEDVGEHVAVSWIVQKLHEVRHVGDDQKAAGRVKAYLQRHGWTYSGAHKRRINGAVTRYWTRPVER